MCHIFLLFVLIHTSKCIVCFISSCYIICIRTTAKSRIICIKGDKIFLFTDSAKKGFRSNSAIDLQAAQRAKARAQYSAMARTKIQSGTASLRKCNFE